MTNGTNMIFLIITAINKQEIHLKVSQTSRPNKQVKVKQIQFVS